MNLKDYVEKYGHTPMQYFGGCMIKIGAAGLGIILLVLAWQTSWLVGLITTFVLILAWGITLRSL